MAEMGDDPGLDIVDSPCGKIVDDKHLVSPPQQLFGEMRSYEPCPPVISERGINESSEFPETVNRVHTTRASSSRAGGCFSIDGQLSAALCWFVLFSVGFSRSSSVSPEKLKDSV